MVQRWFTALSVGVCLAGIVGAQPETGAGGTAASVLARATFLGGSGVDYAYNLAIDDYDNVYVSGLTSSADFPTRAPFRPAPASGFMTKLGANGRIVYSTYVPGSPFAMAIDRTGGVYLAGLASNDAFVTKLMPDGSQASYSVRLGGGNLDRATGIAVDASGNAVVVGSTSSADFPVVNALQPSMAGGRDAFVAKLDSTGRVVFSTFLGGRGATDGTDAGVDAAGNVYAAGTTGSPDFPTTPGSFQRIPARTGPCPLRTACNDAFIVKLNATGSAMIYSTLVGGSLNETVSRMAIDTSGNVYATGSTASPDFPVKNPVQRQCRPNPPPFASCGDAFVFKLNPGGSALDYATFLGGTSSDSGNAIAVDDAGRAYVGGRTDSADFPARLAAQPRNAGGPLFRSNDGGATWHISSAGLQATSVRKLVSSRERSSSSVYALSGRTIFRSRDAGQSWWSSGNASWNWDVVDLAVDPQTPVIVYAATSGGGVFKSLDAGDSWLAINVGLAGPSPSGLFTRAIAVAPSASSTLYLGTTTDGLFKSINGGSTWSPLSRSFHIDAIAVDPRDANIVYAGGFEGIWKTRDGGATWSAPVRPVMERVITQLLIDPNAGSTLHASGVRGIYRSTDGGATWSAGVGASIFGARALALESTAPTTLYAASDDGIYKSADAGFSWTRNYAEQVRFLVSLAVDPTRRGTVYSAGYVGLDGFVATISETGSPLGMSTYLGGRHDDGVNAIAVGRDGRVWIAGETLSSNFPAIDALQQNLRGQQDAFIAGIVLDHPVRDPRRPRWPFANLFRSSILPAR